MSPRKAPVVLSSPGQPPVGWEPADRGAYVDVDVEADGVLHAAVGGMVLPLTPVDQVVGGARAVRGDQQPAPVRLGYLRDRLGQHGDQVGGGVRPGVAGAQQQTGQFLGVVDPTPERVVAERFLERGRRAFLLRVRHHQAAVDTQHHHAGLAHAAGKRGFGQPAGQQLPHMRPGGGADPADRRTRSPAGLFQRPPGGGVRGHRPEHLTLSAQRLHIHDVPAAAGDRDRHIGKHPAPVVQRVEPAAGQHPRQAPSQAGAVGQHPHRHRPGPRHDPLTIRGDPQIGAPCGRVHHQRGASWFRETGRCHNHSFPYQAGTSAFHTPIRTAIRSHR